MKILKNFFTIIGLILILSIEGYLLGTLYDKLGLTTLMESIKNIYSMPVIIAVNIGIFIFINGLIARCIPLRKLKEDTNLYDTLYLARIGLRYVLHVIITIAVTIYAILAVGYILFVTVYDIISPYFKGYEGEFAVGYLLVIGILLVSILISLDHKK